MDVGTVVFQPPPSRFITAAVPANNFGVNATFEVGPVTLQTLAATQKGSVVSEHTYTVGQTTSQAQDRQVRDLDFESGRFFWVVDPDSLPGYPALDILNLNPQSLSPSYRPSQVRVYRYRAAASKSGVNPNLGGITALARRTDSPQQFGPVRWELLIQGTDYFLDQSGLWIVLASKLDQNDYLAVSYRSTDNNLVGTFPEADRGTVTLGGTSQARDTLELIVQPQQGPSPQTPTFRYEMRQVYRVAGADLDAELAAGWHHPQPLGAAAVRKRGDVPAAAGPVDSDRRDRVRPGQPIVATPAGPPSAGRGERVLHHLPESPAIRRCEPPHADRDVRFALPDALVLAAFAGARRPNSRFGSSTTPAAAATARLST